MALLTPAHRTYEVHENPKDINERWKYFAHEWTLNNGTLTKEIWWFVGFTFCPSSWRSVCIRCNALVETSVLEAVDFRAASAASASALPLPLPPKRSYFISSYPTHLFGSGWQKQPLPLPLPKRWLKHIAKSRRSHRHCLSPSLVSLYFARFQGRFLPIMLSRRGPCLVSCDLLKANEETEDLALVSDHWV